MIYVPNGHLYVFYGRMFIQIVCPFFKSDFFLLLSCMNSLHILDINTLSDL